MEFVLGRQLLQGEETNLGLGVVKTLVFEAEVLLSVVEVESGGDS